MAHNNKLQGLKAKVQAHQKVAHNIETSRPHKLNFLNSLPLSHNFTILHKAQQAQFLKHLPTSTKRPHKPNFSNNYRLHKNRRSYKPKFLNSHSLIKNKTTKTSPSLILYKRPCKAQNPKRSVIKLQDSSSRPNKTTILQRSQASKIQDSKSRS